jgi:ferredoxin-type protein NapF
VASRREFFKTLASPIVELQEEKVSLFVRPPYYSDIDIFDKECIKCESKACAKVCEEKIIVIEASGTPIINFTNSGCTFCQECAVACEFNVLNIESKKSKINARFIINRDKCLSHNGSICFSCKEPCLDDAILFKGMFEPIIDLDKCSSCGFCLSRCPTNAIEYNVI